MTDQNTENKQVDQEKKGPTKATSKPEEKKPKNLTEPKAEAEKKQNQPEEEQKKDDKQIYPKVQPGTVVQVHQEITEVNPKGEEKKRIQVFEGTVLKRKHGHGAQATITVRKISDGISVEKIFPLRSPIIKDVKVIKKYRTRRSVLNFLRGRHKRMEEIKENQ